VQDQSDVRGRGIRILERWDLGLCGSMFLTGSGVFTRSAMSSGKSVGSARSPKYPACHDFAGSDRIQAKDTMHHNGEGSILDDRALLRAYGSRLR
jgi:hypothetical protein